MTQAPEIARPGHGGHGGRAPAGAAGADDAAARQARAEAYAQAMLADHTTAVTGREVEYLDAMKNVLRTFQTNQGYPHQMNDALVKSWLTGIRFANRYDMLDEYVAETVAVLEPVLLRVRGVIEATGERECALEAIAGWSSCHYHLVITETHKEPGKRSFLSPFGRVLEAATRMGQFDFDETFVVEKFLNPRMRGFGDVMGVPVTTTWDPQTKLVTVALAD